MSETAPSNVLFVVLDTVRKDRLGPYGCERDTTPVLDEFAASQQVTTFEQAVAPAPWTLPVHASMFTGMYPSQHGASQETPYLEGATTLAQQLSGAGYQTACYSSNTWITPYTQLTDGFDDQSNFFGILPDDVFSGPLARVWRLLNDNETLRALADRLVAAGNTVHERFASSDSADSKTPAVVDRTKSFITDAEAAGDDWFTFINLMDAHLPYHPPEEFRQEFAPGVDSDEVCQNSKEFNSGAREIDEEEWAAIEGLYDAEIAHIDSQLGRLFGWLRETGRWEETAVIVCADHGELHGEHDLYGHEFAVYDQLVNVPLMVKHPAMDGGRHDGTVETVDLYHTVLDTLDVAADEPAAPGESFVPLDRSRSLLRDGRSFDDVADPDPGQAAAPDGSYGFVEYTRPIVELKQLEQKAQAAGIELDEQSRFYSRMRAARRPDGKYVRIDRVADEAYRLDEDPDEQRNVAEGDDEVVQAVERRLSAFEEAAGGAWTDADTVATDEEDPLADMDDDAKDRLRDLGYVE